MDHYASQANKEELDLGKGFDLICGTSTGGILACGLAKGISIKRICDVYKKEGGRIFPSPFPYQGKITKALSWAFKFRKKPSGNITALDQRLTDLLGTTTLEDIYRTRRIALCIPVTNVETRLSKIFKTPHHKDFTHDKPYTLRNVCLATSAAPIIFPLAKLEDPTSLERHDHFADGGLWANCPILVGLVESLKIAEENQPIEIISVGTCAPPAGGLITKRNRGLWDWKIGIESLSLSLDAQAAGHTFIAQLISQHLQCECNIVRLPSTPPPAEDTACLALDLAHSNSLSILENRARCDADTILSEINKNRNSSLKILEDIYTNLPPLQ